LCGGGAIVRVDPKTGRFSGVASGFKTPKAFALEPGGTLLVADEVGGSPGWGYRWRLNLETGDHASIYTFPPSEVATAFGVDAKTGEIFFTRRGLYRLSRDGVSRMNVEGVQRLTSMTMFNGNLLVRGDEPPAVELTVSGEVVGKKQQGGPVTDMVSRGNEIFISYGNGRLGIIREGNTFAETVWEGGLAT
jgi:hypothetical protein